MKALPSPLIALFYLAISWPVSAQTSSASSDSLALARQAVRCSVVYGMAAAAARSPNSQAAAVQGDLMRVAPKLGATRAQIEEWLSQFEAEFKDATSPSAEPGKKMRDEGFMPYQLDVCSNLLTARGRELERALGRQ